MNIDCLSKKYNVKRLNYDDCDDILCLYNSNPQYFEHCPPSPSIELIKEDLSSTPDNVDIKDKYFLGFYENNNLIGIIDIITNYPDKQTCFFGLFMINKEYQNKGIGSELIEDVCSYLKKLKYKHIKLAYVINNDEAKKFWLNNKFIPNKQTKDSKGQLDVVVCLREL